MKTSNLDYLDEKTVEQIDLLLAIEDEIVKGAKGGFCCDYYITEKISLLLKSLGIEKEVK